MSNTFTTLELFDALERETKSARISYVKKRDCVPALMKQVKLIAARIDDNVIAEAELPAFLREQAS